MIAWLPELLLRHATANPLPPQQHHPRSAFLFFFKVRLRPVSPYVARYTPCHRALSFAGGCILITFMSSDIPARFIAPTPMDSAKTLQDPSLTTASKISFSQFTYTNIESFQQGTLVAFRVAQIKIHIFQHERTPPERSFNLLKKKLRIFVTFF